MKTLETIYKVCHSILDLALAATLVWLIFNYKDLLAMVIEQ